MNQAQAEFTPRAYHHPYPGRPPEIRFRPIQAQDMEFLAALYASTRAAEIAVVNWSELQKRSFLLQQFNAQHSFYQEQFQHADYLLIEYQEQPCGRVYVDRRKDEIRLIDIALTESCRNRGIGRALLEELMTEAQARQLPIRIHVEQYNPAFRLYQRLGFQVLEDQGVYLFMEWRPGTQVNTAS